MTKPTMIPTRVQLIRELKATAKLLEQNGAAAERMAPILAARGWPAGTLGDGGARGTGGVDADGAPLPSQSDTTANAAAHRDRWADADEKLARLYAGLYDLLGRGQGFVTDLAAHAAPDAEHEGGHLVRTGGNGGWCIGCGRWVTGADKDRLRGGACNACRIAWYRHQQAHPDASRPLFMQNRPAYVEPDAPVHVDPTELPAAGHVVEATVWHQGETTAVEACDRCGSVDPAVGPSGCPGSFHTWPTAS